MAEIELDCQGLPCPQPVLQSKKTIESQQPETLLITVDNEPAQHNVTRFLESQGYQIEAVEQNGAARCIKALQQGLQQTPQETCPVCAPMTEAEIKRVAENEQQLVFITSSCIGQGDDELGGGLMKNFLATLPEMGRDLWRIILLNAGVKLAVQDSPVLEELLALQSQGISILVCGTCLEHFGLLDHKQVGETTNMLDVVTSLQTASKVIKV